MIERATGPRITRRGLLTGGAGIAGMVGLSQLVPHPADAAPRHLDFPFTLGVASGDPVPDGVLLWTRLAPTPLADDGLGGMPAVDVPVGWEVAEDENMQRVVRSGRAVATPELAHSLHVEVEQLRPGRDYWYRFTVGSHASPVARTRTAPEPGSTHPLALAFASCQEWQSGFYTAYRDMAEQDLDVVLHLGDYIYETAIPSHGGVRRTSLSRTHDATCATLSQYRLRYSLYKTDPDLQAAHHRAPWIVTPDDHEVYNDWADEQVAGLTPEHGLRRRAAAFRAYYENLPLRPSSLPVGPDMQLYRGFRWGALASFHVLDGRQYRSTQAFARRFDEDRTMLGEEQERWLLDGLSSSPATWSMLANQVAMFQLNRFDADGDPEQFHPDIWDGYAAARQRLFSGIQSRGVVNPVVITGDAHWSAAADLKVDFDDPGSATLATEFMGTSISSGGDGTDLSPGSQINLDASPHVRFINNLRGYVTCDVTSDTWRTDFKVVSRVSDQTGDVRVRRSFVVEAGRPGLQDA